MVLCITVICGDFLPFLFVLGFSREGTLSSGPLCPLVNIPCAQAASMNPGGVGNPLSSGSVS